MTLYTSELKRGGKMKIWLWVIIVLVLASAGVYLKAGYFDPVLIYPTSLGALIGAFFGARLLPKVPVKLLKTIFAITISFIGLRMILRAFGVSL